MQQEGGVQVGMQPAILLGTAVLGMWQPKVGTGCCVIVVFTIGRLLMQAAAVSFISARRGVLKSHAGGYQQPGSLLEE